MKIAVREFLRRGIVSFGIGPLVLAVLYYILHLNNVVDTLGVNEMCIGIFSISALAFIVGGMNAIYTIERLPLIFAMLIHGAVLYMCYLLTYLVNDWLAYGTVPVLVFTAIFIVGYLIIWAIIYLFARNKTAKINEVLKEKQYMKCE